MTPITLDAIEARQSELAEMIAAFRVRPTTTIQIPATTIELQPGEHYAGAVLDRGCIKHHLVLMAPRAAERMTWADARAWARSVDGTLPDRQEQSLLFANCKPHLDETWHWSCQEHENDASFAWDCDFYDGLQSIRHKSFQGSAVAVRRIAIAGEKP